MGRHWKAVGAVVVLTGMTIVVLRLNARSEREEAAGRALDLETQFALGALAQCCDLDGKGPWGMREMVDAAKRLYASGGAESLKEAAEIVFAAKKARCMESLDFFGRLKADRRVRDPAAAIRLASAVQASAGERETRDVESIVREALTAAERSSTSVEQILEATVENNLHKLSGPWPP